MRFLQPKLSADADGFYEAVAAEAVQAGHLTAVTLNGQKVVLTRYDGRLYAFTAVCPHAAADLSHGHLSRHKISCQDHDFCFDLRNGRILWPEDENYRLRTFATKEVDGRVKVKL